MIFFFWALSNMAAYRLYYMFNQNLFKISVQVFAKFPGSKSREAKISIIKDFRGTIKPGR